MPATITDLDADRRRFAEFLAVNVLYYVKHRMAVWPFDGEDTQDNYFWARTDGNAKFRALDHAAIHRHLNGIKISRSRYSGIGVPALADAGWAGLGVIDIDTHTTGIIVDCEALAAVCDPAAIVTRSSSGRGVHIYFFPPPLVPINSHVLRLAMDFYTAHLMNFGVIPADAKIDMFPKSHGVAHGEPAERILAGGSVRFPFAARRRVNFNNYPDTWDAPDEHPGEIYWGGQWASSFEERQRIISIAQTEHLSWLATWGGPPCLGKILHDGADEGERNTLIYDAAYFAGFATHDETLAAKWVWDRIIPQLRGSAVVTREVDKTIRSGIEHALDPTKPQYVCTTTLCDKNEGRCMRLGQTMGSGYTAGSGASNAANEKRNAAATNMLTSTGPSALTIRDGILYIGDTALRIEYCPIDEKYYVYANGFLQRFTSVSIMQSSTIAVLAALIQRGIVLPKGSQRGWLTLFLSLARHVARVYHHPAYGQLKSALYMITQTESTAVSMPAIAEAIPSHRGYSLDAAVRHYPDKDWVAVISPENKVLGMRLAALDHDFLTIMSPSTPPPPPPPKSSTDY
jgi:hypothetical protein